MYDEPESPDEVACLRCMFKMYDEPESPDEVACLRCIMNRNRQMRGRV